MGVTTKHSIYGVNVGGTMLGGITQQSIVSESEIEQEATSGEIYSRFQSIRSLAETPSFTTRAIATALGLLAFPCKSLADLSGGLMLYAQKHQHGGSRATGSVHRRYTFVDGVLFPQSLSWDHAGVATLSVGALITYDGVNEPLVITDSVTLPVLAAQSEVFGMGPVTLAGKVLAGKTQGQLDFGIQATGEAADGEVRNTFASLEVVNPTLTLTGLHQDWLSASRIPLTGTAGTHANSTVYLRKRADGGTYVADGTSQHIKMTMAGLITPQNIFEGSGPSAGTVSIRMPLKFDGTNAPVVIDTASTIS